MKKSDIIWSALLILGEMGYSEIQCFDLKNKVTKPRAGNGKSAPFHLERQGQITKQTISRTFFSETL